MDDDATGMRLIPFLDGNPAISTVFGIIIVIVIIGVGIMIGTGAKTIAVVAKGGKKPQLMLSFSY